MQLFKYLVAKWFNDVYRTIKNIDGKKTLANLANYRNSPSFLPIFTIFITFPMQMDFISRKFFSAKLPTVLICQIFLLYST